jgi:ABC-type antimicrobial peptide transport system permease subunit
MLSDLTRLLVIRVVLTIYTTVAGRTRQIGILKALGASKRFIAMVFIKESMLVSAISRRLRGSRSIPGQG